MDNYLRGERDREWVENEDKCWSLTLGLSSPVVIDTCGHSKKRCSAAARYANTLAINNHGRVANQCFFFLRGFGFEFGFILSVGSIGWEVG